MSLYVRAHHSFFSLDALAQDQQDYRQYQASRSSNDHRSAGHVPRRKYSSVEALDLIIVIFGVNLLQHTDVQHTDGLGQWIASIALLFPKRLGPGT